MQSTLITSFEKKWSLLTLTEVMFSSVDVKSLLLLLLLSGGATFLLLLWVGLLFSSLSGVAAWPPPFGRAVVLVRVFGWFQFCFVVNSISKKKKNSK